MQVLIRGLRREITEQRLREKFAPYAPVRSVEIMRDGDPEQPWAWVDFDMDLVAALGLLRQFDGQYFEGGVMRLHLVPHQSSD